ncbi:deoxyribonuclease [Helicobacter anseris]|uniref:Deoxyribonuclease n=1 Tax=Helicobacter anseris TaxID=375926 RepID=A0A3D8J696_9HELI|nr:endonuclease [Helicobacter anseris]RDU72331.1 deoxyribonuclease [Helicobacter anseris]
MKRIILLLLIASVSQADFSSFSNTKKELIKIYEDLGSEFQKDFYCNAPFEIIKKGKKTELKIIKSENYTPRVAITKKGKINKRSQFIEWEHIVPAENFGRHLQCWKNGGRKACQKDEAFKEMEADPMNLVPAIGEINGDRNNFRYAQAPKDLVFSQYGKCRVFTDFKAKRFYPADYSKGYIARTYLYFENKYPNFKLSKQEKQLMEAWNKLYPETDEEKILRETIKQEKKD